MKDDDLKTLFDKAPLPSPSATVRRRIKSEALAAFRQAQAERTEKTVYQAQGLQGSTRPTADPPVITTTTSKPQMKKHVFAKHRSTTGLAASLALAMGLY